MLILKILNNNAVLSRDRQNNEVIVTGKGIAFRKKVYDEIDADQVLQIYVPKNKQQKSHMEALVSEIPIDYFIAAMEIKQLAEKELNCTLDDGISLQLSDHIHYAVDKIAKNISTPNLMLNEIRQFYPKEYEIGLKASKRINQRFSTCFNEDEAGFIAFHIVSCEDKNGSVDVQTLMERLHDIIQMIETYFHLPLSDETIRNSRLITHLKYFLTKVSRPHLEKEQNLKEDNLYQMLVKKYSEINLFLDQLDQYTYKNCQYHLSDSDRMYLIIHLARII